MIQRTGVNSERRSDTLQLFQFAALHLDRVGVDTELVDQILAYIFGVNEVTIALVGAGAFDTDDGDRADIAIFRFCCSEVASSCRRSRSAWACCRVWRQSSVGMEVTLMGSLIISSSLRARAVDIDEEIADAGMRRRGEFDHERRIEAVDSPDELLLSPSSVCRRLLCASSSTTTGRTILKTLKRLPLDDAARAVQLQLRFVTFQVGVAFEQLGFALAIVVVWV